MARDIISLGLAVDSTPAVKATSDLDRLATAGAKAEDSLQQVGVAASGAQAPLQGAAAASARLQTEQVRSVQNVRAATLSAKQYAQALRYLPAQITDIVTGLASGQSAFLVAIQQGGQLRDSFGGFGATLRAFGTVITPARLAIGGLAAVAAVTAKAFFDGQKESFELEKSVILTGNAAGVTAGQLAVLATQIDRIVGTRAKASATLALAVTGGGISANLLGPVVQAAEILERVTGRAVEETIKQFAELGKEPVRAAEALQDKYHFLTVEIYDQIRALQAQGRFAEAAQAAQKALLDATVSRTAELSRNLGYLPRAWSSIKEAAKDAWDAMLGIGRKETPEEELNRLLQSRAGRFVAPLRGGGPARENPRIQELRDIVGARQREAAAQKAEADAVEERIRNAQLEQVRLAAAGQTAAATLQANLAQTTRALSASLDAQANYTKVIEAQHAAHLISDSQYYGERLKLIERDRAAQVAALQSENRLIAADSERVKRAALQTAAASGSPAERLKAELAVQPQLIANQDKIRANIAEIARLNADAATSAKVLDIQQRAAAEAVIRGYEEARASAQSYLDTLRRQQELQIAGIGAGDAARQFNQGRSEIQADYERQRQQLESERRRQQITRKQYETELEIINEFERKALKSYDDYYDALRKKQGSFFAGVSEALANYLDTAQNTAASVSEAFQHAFDNATDALVQFATTGKGSFKDLVNSIIADLLRIQLQKQLAGIFSSVIGSIAGAFGGEISPVTVTQKKIPAYASGTDYVPRTGLALVHKGERIIPARENAAGVSGSRSFAVNIYQTLNAHSGVDVAQVGAIMRQAKDEAVNEVAQRIGSGSWGGLLATSLARAV